MLCDYAFETEGKISMIGIFDRLELPGFPYEHWQLFLVISVSISAADGVLDCSAIAASESGETVGLVEGMRFVTTSGILTTKTNTARFENLRFDKPGNYHFEIFINSQSVHVVPLLCIIG